MKLAENCVLLGNAANKTSTTAALSLDWAVAYRNSRYVRKKLLCSWAYSSVSQWHHFLFTVVTQRTIIGALHSVIFSQSSRTKVEMTNKSMKALDEQIPTFGQNF